MRLLCSRIQRQSISLFQTHCRLEGFPQPEQMLGGRFHGLLVTPVLDGDGCLEDIAAGLLQWGHILQGRESPPRFSRLLLAGGIMQHAVQEDDNIIVNEDVPLDQILSHKARTSRLARQS